MKAKPCTLVVNTAHGYIFTPVECASISEAHRRGKNWLGFAYRIFVNDESGKTRVIRGYCNG